MLYINICMHEYSGDTRAVVLHMLYHNVIMHGVCNSQLNVEQSHILFEFVVMCGVCNSHLNTCRRRGRGTIHYVINTLYI